jgi:hypothetical protein
MSHVLCPILLKPQESILMQSIVKLLQSEGTFSKGACSAVVADEKVPAQCAPAPPSAMWGLSTPGRALTPQSREPFPAVVGRYQEECSKGFHDPI